MKLIDIEAQITLLYHCKMEFERLYGKDCYKDELYQRVCNHLDRVNMRGKDDE